MKLLDYVHLAWYPSLFDFIPLTALQPIYYSMTALYFSCLQSVLTLIYKTTVNYLVLFMTTLFVALYLTAVRVIEVFVTVLYVAAVSALCATKFIKLQFIKDSS